ncbi:MAG: hypothetical protein HZB91_07880 [Elusimicrobia bacterium]|nr:hypothetical protein [Elusimicrobiota bacterium]
MRTFLGVCAVFLFSAAGQAQVHRRPGTPGMSGDCLRCHATAAPTRERHPLSNCPRPGKGRRSAGQGPGAITMGEISDQYGPVTFSHRKHADMAEMGEGCVSCHEDTDGPFRKCAACHSTSRRRDDLSKPDLKAALHRLCVDCHLEWGRSTECLFCHAPKPGTVRADSPAANAFPKGGRDGALPGTEFAAPAAKGFPRARKPGRLVFETNFEGGRVVTFFHDDHAERFGLKCVDCHRKRSCASCHDPAKAGAGPQAEAPGPARKTASMEDLHRPCASCHADDSCAFCHRDRPAERFDHAKKSGWPLNRFHARLACRRCHGAGPAAPKPPSGCDACHAGWQAKFEHKKTGAPLNEAHRALECSSCHGEKEFSAPPACGGCHEGRSYPKDRP